MRRARDAAAGGGADPNDSQTLYNRHFEENDDHLKLLFSYGLGRNTDGPWLTRLGDRGERPSTMLVQQLCWAAHHNFADRVRLLVEHGVDVNMPSGRTGRTPYQGALREGDHVIELGADPCLRDHAYHAAPIGWADYGQHGTSSSTCLPSPRSSTPCSSKESSAWPRCCGRIRRWQARSTIGATRRRSSSAGRLRRHPGRHPGQLLDHPWLGTERGNTRSTWTPLGGWS